MSQSLTGKLTTTRRGAIIIGIGAALLAGILLVVYLNRYRNSVQGETAPTTVLVAKSLIVANTSGTVMAEKKLFETTSIPQKEVKTGAILDPAYLNGRVATADIFPGQQLTTADFTAGTTTAVTTKLTGRQRALTIPIDNIHGSLSQVQVGDHVDVYVAFTASNGGAGGAALVKLFRPNVLVLGVPTTSTDTSGNTVTSGGVILRIPSKDAADFAYAADNAKFWFVLRPQADAKPTKPTTATQQSLLK